MAESSVVRINGLEILASGHFVAKHDAKVEIENITGVGGIKIYFKANLNAEFAIGKTFTTALDDEPGAVLIELRKSWTEVHSNLTANIGIIFADNENYEYYFAYVLMTVGPKDNYVHSVNYEILRGMKS